MSERDFFADPLTERELRDLLGDTAPADAFVWRSPRAKELSLDPKVPPSDDELVRLMLEVPYFIRRPVVRIGGQTVFGFDKKALEQLAGGD